MLTVNLVFGQEIPEVVQFHSSDYGGDHQNWQVTQDCQGRIFIANSECVLSYNGMKWEKIYLPENRKVRSVYTGTDCKVYTGGYKTFGYIDYSENNIPVYVDITDSLLAGGTQEIWNIFGNKDYIVFQSFSNIYLYDYNQIMSIIPPTNIMLGKNVDQQLYIPSITQGLFTMNGPEMKMVESSQLLPEDSKIAALCQSPHDDKVIIATQYHGVYFLDDNEVIPLESNVNDLWKIEQINRMIRLASGDYVVGTILNGIYILDSNFQIKYNINKTNGLTNNTVLSLYEGRTGDVWVGLDKGVNLIKLSDPITYYYDIAGQLGTFFCSINYADQLFVGTNQGVFIKQENESFKLLPGLQGQAWSFLDTADELLCGHNNGIYLIRDDVIERLNTSTGIWWMKRLDENTIMASSYTGLILLKKTGGQWSVIRRIENGDVLLEKFVLNENGVLVGYNPQNDLYVLKFDKDYEKVLNVESFSLIGDQTINSNISLFNLEGNIVVRLEDQSFVYINNEFHALNTIDNNDEIEYLLQKSPNYHAYQLTRYIGDRMPRLAQKIDGYSNYLISFVKGYATIPIEYEYTDYQKDSIYIDKIHVNGAVYSPEDIVNPEFSHAQNNIVIQLGNKNYNDYLEGKYEFKLEGWSDQWYPLPEDGRLEFINLRDKDYKLVLKRNPVSDEVEMWNFTIEPVWYKSWRGFVLFLFVMALLIWILNRRLNINLEKERERLREEKRIELERERMKSKNEKLERELVHKSKLLANSALTLAQKNRMLIEMKSTIKKLDKHDNPISKLKQKLMHLIDVNINSDDEWEIFEKNFEEVHESFLISLKNNYPTITAGELRLAAYIKMNLSSKEIAPLMNISVRSVENKRYRLRKKMNLASEETLSDYLVRF
jgi:DNA-binding CsgD family transcriptional regulator